MRLAEDDRARVPFALVGVVLLVGAATYVATVADRPDPAGRPDAVAAMDRADAVVAAAVERGTERAARDAARAPVIEPAGTVGGAVIGGNDTFREYLRVRIYLAVREALAASPVVLGDARVEASLPATPDAAALRAAKRRVTLTRVDGGLRVRVENVTLALRTDGYVAERSNRTVTRMVATPVVAVHERVQRYERLLNRDTADGPGLARRLTARANAIAWVRGYSQYGGAPISNVLSNRHLELATNGALLSTQRAVFGRSDPAGRNATYQAAGIVGVTDVLMGGITATDTVNAVPGRPGQPTGPAPPKPPAPRRPPDAATGNVTVAVDISADRAFRSLVSGGDPSMEAVLDDVYGATVRVVGADHPFASTRTGISRPAGANWTLVWNRTSVVRSVGDTAGHAPTPDLATGWHSLERYTRRVVVNRTTSRRWTREARGETQVRTTKVSRVETRLVTVAVVGRHAESPFAPRHGIERIHERGGPLGGPNLVDVRDAAVERVVEEFGSPAALARAQVTGNLTDEELAVDGARPGELRGWLYEDLAALRDRVRRISVTVPRRRLGAGDVNPAAELADVLRDRRDSLAAATGTYGSVAGKARVAVRLAYIDAVVDRLDARAAKARQTRSRFDEVLSDAGVDEATMSTALDVGASTPRPPARSLATGGPLGSLNASVSARPAYLTLSGVTHERVPAVPPGERFHPLVARNRNLFTAPYDDVADGVTSHLFGSERTNLGTAARTLRSANHTLERGHDPELARHRLDLQVSVARSLQYVRDRLRETVAATDGLSRRDARAAVAAGIGRWSSTHERALAAANGSLAVAVKDAARRRLADPGGRRADRLAVRLRVTLSTVRDSELARPREPAVNRTATLARGATKETVRATFDRGSSTAARVVQRRLGRQVVLPPAGLPVAPVPGYWYATTNVWTATVRGTYLRFSVSVPTGRPGRELTYEREREAVALDWDGDGVRERLGRSTRVSFEVSTAVVVVVPPGGPGVGDHGGGVDERSSGWPRPGNASGEVTTTSTGGE